MLKQLVKLFLSRRVQGQLRHVIGAVGGFVVAFGWFDEQRTLAVTGLLIAMSAFAASWRAPEKRFYEEHNEELPTEGVPDVFDER